MQLQKSTQSSIGVPGRVQAGGPDAIFHDDDRIYLLLNPTIDVAMSSSTAEWMLSANSNASPIIQWVSVGMLNGHQPIPAGVARYLTSAEITPADYPDILARDPLANGTTVLDPKRFTLLTRQITYEAPSDIDSFELDNSSTQTNTQAFEDTYTVGLTATHGPSFFTFVSADLTQQGKWIWTNKNEISTSTGTTQAATATLNGPATGYSGPTQLEIYYDTLYKTFAFVLVDPSTLPLAVTGALKDSSGQPIGGADVKLVQDGIVKQSTFTSPTGEYRFYGRIDGRATIETAGASPQMVPLPGLPAVTVNVIRRSAQ